MPMSLLQWDPQVTSEYFCAHLGMVSSGLSYKYLDTSATYLGMLFPDLIHEHPSVSVCFLIKAVMSLKVGSFCGCFCRSLAFSYPTAFHHGMVQQDLFHWGPVPWSWIFQPQDLWGNKFLTEEGVCLCLDWVRHEANTVVFPQSVNTCRIHRWALEKSVNYQTIHTESRCGILTRGKPV